MIPDKANTTSVLPLKLLESSYFDFMLNDDLTLIFYESAWFYVNFFKIKWRVDFNCHGDFFTFMVCFRFVRPIYPDDSCFPCH